MVVLDLLILMVEVEGVLAPSVAMLLQAQKQVVLVVRELHLLFQEFLPLMQAVVVEVHLMVEQAGQAALVAVETLVRLVVIMLDLRDLRTQAAVAVVVHTSLEQQQGLF
jgi:hypothetical protein